MVPLTFSYSLITGFTRTLSSLEKEGPHCKKTPKLLLGLLLERVDGELAVGVSRQLGTRGKRFHTTRSTYCTLLCSHKEQSHHYNNSFRKLPRRWFLKDRNSVATTRTLVLNDA